MIFYMASDSYLKASNKKDIVRKDYWDDAISQIFVALRKKIIH